MKWRVELPDGSYSISDIQDYFEYIMKKRETVIHDPSIMIYLNKIENRITLKIKTKYYLEFFTKNENGENVLI